MALVDTGDKPTHPPPSHPTTERVRTLTADFNSNAKDPASNIPSLPRKFHFVYNIFRRFISVEFSVQTVPFWKFIWTLMASPCACYIFIQLKQNIPNNPNLPHCLHIPVPNLTHVFTYRMLRKQMDALKNLVAKNHEGLKKQMVIFQKISYDFIFYYYVTLINGFGNISLYHIN